MHIIQTQQLPFNNTTPSHYNDSNNSNNKNNNTILANTGTIHHRTHHHHHKSNLAGSRTSTTTNMTAAAEYAFPSVLQFLQSEWRRFERDRNEWDIEKAEMKARISYLEGEKRGIDNTKMDLMKRVKMLEFALRQERTKYVDSKLAAAANANAAGNNASDNNTSAKESTGNNMVNNSNRASTYSTSGQSMSQVSPTTGHDPSGRAKSREFLRICLKEISYLTASVPPATAMAMPPPAANGRYPRHDLENRRNGNMNGNGNGFGPRGGPNGLHHNNHNGNGNGHHPPGARNRNSDFFPMMGASYPPPPPLLPRSNSTPLTTLNAMREIKANAGSPPLETVEDHHNMTGSVDDERGTSGGDQSTVRQGVVAASNAVMHPQPTSAAAAQAMSAVSNNNINHINTNNSAVPETQQKENNNRDKESSGENLEESKAKPANGPTVAATAAASVNSGSGSSSPTSLSPTKKTSGSSTSFLGHDPERDSILGQHIDGMGEDDGDQVTAVHAPLSSQDWHAQIQLAAKEKRAKKSEQQQQQHLNAMEDEAQLARDVQDKFHISSGKANKMIKGWSKNDSLSAAGTGVGKASLRKKKGSKDAGILGELGSLTVADTETQSSEAGSDEKGNDGTGTDPVLWRTKVTLKRHLDSVRTVAFHPKERALLSGSDDGTLRYWNLEASLTPNRRLVNAEIDPIHTYRGHTRAVTSVAISAEQGKCFSASLDSTVRTWSLVPMDKETYARSDPSLVGPTLIGHTDAVWDIRLFPLQVTGGSSSPLLASISADGQLKIWDTETKGSPLRSSWGYKGLLSGESDDDLKKAVIPRPTSLDFLSTDLKKIVVSYSNSIMKLFDLETGQSILTFDSAQSYDGTTATQINKVISHPTIPMVMSGHEDRYIRFFDVQTGKCQVSMVAHMDSVSTLDVDPSGLFLCSGGHDASIRVWDIGSGAMMMPPSSNTGTGVGLLKDEVVNTFKDDGSTTRTASPRPSSPTTASASSPTTTTTANSTTTAVFGKSAVCVQEFTGHRRKGDEGVCTVRYHPLLPGILASGGADSIVKIYTRS